MLKKNLNIQITQKIQNLRKLAADSPARYPKPSRKTSSGIAGIRFATMAARTIPSSEWVTRKWIMSMWIKYTADWVWLFDFTLCEQSTGLTCNDYTLDPESSSGWRNFLPSDRSLFFLFFTISFLYAGDSHEGFWFSFFLQIAFEVVAEFTG